MKRIQIKKNNIVTNQCELPSLEADAWLAEHLAMNSFGKPAVYESVLNEETGEFEQVLITPAEEFEIVESDITAQIEQERINREAMEYLAKTDYLIMRELCNGIPCPSDIRELRQAARSRIVK